MPIADWTRDESWDVCVLGGRRMPGVSIVNVTLPSGLDVKKPKGSRKGRVRDEGAPPASIEIRVTLLPAELAEFEQSIVPLLRPRATGAARDPLAIAHPNARLWGVHTVMVGDISSPTPGAGAEMVITVSATEHVPPTAVKKSKEKPKGSDEGWDVEAEIAALQTSAPTRASTGFESPGDLMSIDPSLL